MSQRRRHSALEVVVGTTIGFAGSYWLGIVVLPLMGFPISHEQNFTLVSIFTVWSLLRGYGVRRLFNYIHHKEWFL